MKKFMKIAFVAAFVAVAGYSVYASQKSDIMSDLALANVEALAWDEIIVGQTCDCLKNSYSLYYYALEQLEEECAFYN